jgi:hypothetical protein
MLALAILIGGHHIGWSLAVLPAWVLLISVYLIFLRIEFPRIGRKIQERDVVGNGEIAGAMVGSTVENQKDVLAANLRARTSRNAWKHAVFEVGMIR